MKKIAVIDIDDTLGDMRTLLCDSLNRFSNKNIHFSQWKNHKVESSYEITTQELFSLLSYNFIIERMQPHMEAKQFLQTLSNKGYHVVLLTARRWHERGHDVTRAWLKEHELKYDELILCEIYDNKAKIIENRYPEIEFIADDSLTQCNNYIQSPIVKKAFVYDMPWNSSIKIDELKSFRIGNLNEIFKYLD